MKKKNFSKILIPVSVLPLCSMSIVSCNNDETNYDKLAKVISQDVIDQFMNITGSQESDSFNLRSGEHDRAFYKFHRSTFNTEPFITDYLKPKILEICKQSGIQIDETSFEDIPYDAREHKTDFTGKNFYFDIPANPADNDMVPIAIQCHTDMVWDGDENMPFVNACKNSANNIIKTATYTDPKTGIQYDATTLGADNGVGIASVLAICKHTKDFKHGPIRFLMTTDEEDGPSGASAIGNDVFTINQDRVYGLINIDLEDNDIMGKSCCGTQQAKWSLEYKGETEGQTGHKLTKIDTNKEHVYELDIDGLLGGHSGLNINENRINSVKLGFDILSSINYDGKLRLIQVSTNSRPDDKSVITSKIPNEIHIKFCTDLPQTTVNKLVQCNIEIAKRKHPIEDKGTHKITYKCHKISDSSVTGFTAMTNYDTNDLIRFISDLWYGPISWLETGAVETCASIGTVLFRCNDADLHSEEGTFEVNVIGRSSNIDELGNNPDGKDPDKWEGFMQANRLIGLKIFGENVELQNPWKPMSWTPPWSPKENDQLQAGVLAASKALKVPLTPSDEPGWLEVAYFDEVSEHELNMVCIGPTIDDAHTKNETLHTDSIPPMIKILLYTLEHLPIKTTLKGGNINE